MKEEIGILIGHTCTRINEDSKHDAHGHGGGPGGGGARKNIWHSGQIVGEIQFHNDFALVRRAHVITGHAVDDIGKSYYHDPDFFDSIVKLVNKIPRPRPKSAYRYSGRR